MRLKCAWRKNRNKDAPPVIPKGMSLAGTQPTDKFPKQYEQFMSAVKNGLRQKLRDSKFRSERWGNEPSTKEQLLDSIFEPLMCSKALEAIGCVARENVSKDGHAALGWELQYLAEGEFDPENAKVAKDSIEDLIGKKLPDWVREPLHILNEVLKIAGGKGTD